MHATICVCMCVCVCVFTLFVVGTPISVLSVKSLKYRYVQLVMELEGVVLALTKDSPSVLTLYEQYHLLL